MPCIIYFVSSFHGQKMEKYKTTRKNSKNFKLLLNWCRQNKVNLRTGIAEDAQISTDIRLQVNEDAVYLK